ncbi:hypothetical protein DCE79_15620 [Lysinibacillus sp. 2017]|uniref:hypothetical protein n=2 Tax=unclassified Lysinibacillus TaxID=2636778 RepID=UPI000D529CEA|nr:hypothetical protein [Lysinibacillus sp. 2017]AWE08713.1 hypothetical protein DCE79_15620 [Lysinibacillus sp. 2017]
MFVNSLRDGGTTNNIEGGIFQDSNEVLNILNEDLLGISQKSQDEIFIVVERYSNTYGTQSLSPEEQQLFDEIGRLVIYYGEYYSSSGSNEYSQMNYSRDMYGKFLEQRQVLKQQFGLKYTQ